MSALLRIACPHCQRSIGVDGAKMPSKPVSFACPSCGGKVVLDPAQLGGAPAADREPPQQEPQTEVSKPASPPAQEPATNLELPPGVTLPHGVIAGEDAALVEQIQRLLAPYECRLEVLNAAAQVSALPLEELPPLLIYVAGTVGRPPLEPMLPFTKLPPATRRRSFIVLVADNIATLDGTAAFFHEVNLIVNRNDVPKVASLLYSSLQFHRRLWGPFFAALEARAGG